MQIIEIVASDKDTGNNARITYRITAEFTNSSHEDHFGIQSNTGWVYIKKPLDRESASTHKMTITATDNGIPPLSTTTRLVINVIDANDNEPEFLNGSYEFYVEENLKIGAYVGIVAATDVDLGDNAAVRYALLPSNTSFVVDPVTGNVIITFLILQVLMNPAVSLP